MSAATPLPDSGRQAAPRTVAARTPRRTMLSLVPSPIQARRAPFVALLLVLLASGLVALLLVNTASAQDAFTLNTLQRKEAALAQQMQVYSSLGDGLDNPATLAARATALGMIPGGIPIFLARGAPLPVGGIRVGNEVYIPGPVQLPVVAAPKPTTPAVAVAPKAAAKTAVSPKAAVVPKAPVKPKTAVTPKAAVIPKAAVKPKAAVTPARAAKPPTTGTPTGTTAGTTAGGR